MKFEPEGIRAAAHGGFEVENLTQCLGHKTDSEQGLPGFVQEFHVPFGVLLQATRKAANQIAADLGHLHPGGVPVDEIKTVVGNATEVVVTDPDEIGRHAVAFFLGRDASAKAHP
jgi:hypothetical protein